MSASSLPQKTAIGAPAVRDTTLVGISERLDEFCRHFDVAAPKLKMRRGDPVLTEEFVRWFIEAGASWEWIIDGDPRPMMQMYRETKLREREMVDTLTKLGPERRELLLEALNGWKEAVRAKEEETL